MKLCVVVDAALAAGPKCAQACHALREFIAAYPEVDTEWYRTSNTIVILQHANLPHLVKRLQAHGVRVACFYEPDMGGALTALCVEPAGRWHLRRLRLVT